MSKTEGEETIADKAEDKALHQALRAPFGTWQRVGMLVVKIEDKEGRAPPLEVPTPKAVESETPAGGGGEGMDRDEDAVRAGDGKNGGLETVVAANGRVIMAVGDLEG